MKVLKTLLVLCVWFSLCAISQAGCPFSDPVRTFHENLERSELIVSGRLIYSSPANPRLRLPEISVIEIQNIEKGRLEDFAIDQLLAVPVYFDLPLNSTVRIPGNFSRQKNFYWGISSTETLNSEAFQHLVQLPGKFANERERLTYYYPYLGHPNPQIAENASREFQKATLEDLETLSDIYQPEELRTWFQSSRKHPEFVIHSKLLAIMLGFCGNHDDAEQFKSLIFASKDQYQLGADGVIIGYLLLSGEAGLTLLDEQILNNQQSGFSLTYGVMQALRSMWTLREHRIDSARLIRSIRYVLERPKIVDLAIAQLTDWKDWETMESVVAMYDHPKFQEPIIQHSIVRYLLAAKNDHSSDSKNKNSGVHALVAEKHLQRIRAIDPETVRKVELFFVD